MMRVALFIGTDLHSHILAKRFLEAPSTGWITADLYFPDRRSAGPSVSDEMQAYIDLEHGVLPEVIYPALMAEKRGGRPSRIEAWTYFGEAFGVQAERVEDINAPVFLSSLAERHYDVAISVRCYQKFGHGIMRLFDNDDRTGRLWNLHPGALPAYRGVMSYFRQLWDGQLRGIYTLHVINEKWDAGAILASCPRCLDPSLSVLSNYCKAAPEGVRTIESALASFDGAQVPDTKAQDESAAAYWSAPGAQDLVLAGQAGIALVNEASLRADLASVYGSSAVEAFRQWSEAARHRRHRSIRSNEKEAITGR